jgi:hypothetical protein
MSEKTEQTASPDWADKEISELQPVAAPKGVDEKAVAQKVAAGLTRAQAIEVLQAQAAHDAAQVPAKKKAAKGE